MKFILPFTLAAGALAATAQTVPTTLKDAFKNDFLIGAALNQSQFEGESPRETQIVTRQFNTISPENVLKWESVHPSPDQFDFADADRYVAFGEKNHMFIIGHNLIWHSQTPRWVFRDSEGNQISRDGLIARMRKHILTVAGRYKGRIGGWDVVNEALNEDGTLRDSAWRRIIGDDYLALAYQFAHEADPQAQLYYNDYSLENLPKQRGAVALIEKLRAEGVKIDGIGLQEHDKMNWPSTGQVDETISAFAGLGIKVMITELDIDMLPAATRSFGADVSMRAAADAKLNPYANGLPDWLQQKLAQRYADLFSVFVAHRGQITRVTFWGVTDGDSWLNNWPVRGRTSYPLLFDRNSQPKAAFAAVIHTATE
ncbi:MAG TPA: endo-1,4-beta-xylanase [Verrucomicrobiae bacterium]|nr:endo-1,4-beta-xylanase [Verrucomicrobiae bacterium]